MKNSDGRNYASYNNYRHLNQCIAVVIKNYNLAIDRCYGNNFERNCDQCFDVYR